MQITIITEVSFSDYPATESGAVADVFLGRLQIGEIFYDASKEVFIGNISVPPPGRSTEYGSLQKAKVGIEANVAMFLRDIKL
jgi:hypothetical protein